MDQFKPSRLAVVAWALIVFVLSVLLRLPSCYESFWLDELHTAWAIWDDFVDVRPRAEVGNQTPLYFQLIWVWKQIVGGSEVALRFSSILATALASALLVIAVTQTTRRLSGGVLAGTILAIETNSIFFGTELRPYALVMLCSVVALWAGVELVMQRSDRSTQLRIIFALAACLAGLFHPTSIVAFGVLAFALVIIGAITWLRSTDRRIQFALADMIWLIILFATIFALFNSSLPNSWERRDNWRAFGVARSAWQLWTIWPWAAIAILPVALGAVTAWKKPPREVVIALLPLSVAVVATTIFFVTSYYDFVPLWHRRYLVAVLPMLAWSAGAFSTMGFPDRATWWSRTIAAMIVTAVLIFIARQDHGIADKLQMGDTRFAIRGEDWRGAIAYVRQRRDTQDESDSLIGINAVWLDTDLIEASVFNRPFSEEVELTQLQADYFRFPAQGPYALNQITVTTPNAIQPHGQGELPAHLAYVGTKKDRNPLTIRDYVELVIPVGKDTDALWIISRGRSKVTMDRWCDSLWITPFNEPEFRRFGRIWVVKIPQPTRKQLKQWLENAYKSDDGL